jgi:hypothetical protein
VVGGQLGGNIAVRTSPPLNPSQKAALANAVSRNPDLPTEMVERVEAGTSPGQSLGVQGVTYNENDIVDSPNAIPMDPNALPNSSKYAAPGVFSAGDIVQESGKVAYVYYIANNGDGTTTPYLATAPPNDPNFVATIKAKIDNITGNVGLTNINQGVLDALKGGVSDALETALRSLNKIVNQLNSTTSDKIDEDVKQKTQKLVNSLSSVISQVEAAIKDVNKSVA